MGSLPEKNSREIFFWGIAPLFFLLPRLLKEGKQR